MIYAMSSSQVFLTESLKSPIHIWLTLISFNGWKEVIDPQSMRKVTYVCQVNVQIGLWICCLVSAFDLRLRNLGPFGNPTSSSEDHADLMGTSEPTIWPENWVRAFAYSEDSLCICPVYRIASHPQNHCWTAKALIGLHGCVRWSDLSNLRRHLGVLWGFSVLLWVKKKKIFFFFFWTVTVIKNGIKSCKM